MNHDALVYRWHELMFRLDDLDEVAASGMDDQEASAFDRERGEIVVELSAIEARLGDALVPGLRAGHERDRAYARQVRQIEEESE